MGLSCFTWICQYNDKRKLSFWTVLYVHKYSRLFTLHFHVWESHSENKVQNLYTEAKGSMSDTNQGLSKWTANDSLWKAVMKEPFSPVLEWMVLQSWDTTPRKSLRVLLDSGDGRVRERSVRKGLCCTNTPRKASSDSQTWERSVGFSGRCGKHTGLQMEEGIWVWAFFLPLQVTSGLSKGCHPTAWWLQDPPFGWWMWPERAVPRSRPDTRPCATRGYPVLQPSRPSQGDNASPP